MYLQAFFIFAGFYLNQFVGRAGWLGLESLSARFGKLADPVDGMMAGMSDLVAARMHGDSLASRWTPGIGQPQP